VSARPYVKGERRKRVEAVRAAADKVLAAQDYAQAYMAFAELARAVNGLDEHIEATVGYTA
jgi:hypothetical protein